MTVGMKRPVKVKRVILKRRRKKRKISVRSKSIRIKIKRVISLRVVMSKFRRILIEKCDSQRLLNKGKSLRKVRRKKLQMVKNKFQIKEGSFMLELTRKEVHHTFLEISLVKVFTRFGLKKMAL